MFKKFLLGLFVFLLICLLGCVSPAPVSIPFFEPSYLSIAEEVNADHFFEEDFFMCYDYAVDYNNRLRKKGFDSDVFMFVCRDEIDAEYLNLSECSNTPHALVVIHFPEKNIFVDAITLNVFEENDLKDFDGWIWKGRE